MTSNYLLRLVHIAHWGFLLSLLYGVITSFVVWTMQRDAAVAYVEAFVMSFNCLVSGGLVIATGLFVLFTGKQVPALIERCFTPAALGKTPYPQQKRSYESKIKAALASASYILIAYLIFYLCRFPLSGWAEIFMIAFACLQYGILVYVGRKIYFIAHMLNALSGIRLRKSVLGNRDIGHVVSYVNIVTTLTVASVYANVSGYYNGPFVFQGVIGHSAKLFLLFMVVASVPVIVMFNFYPRVILRILYERSIKHEVATLKKKLSDKHLSRAELETVLIDYDRVKQAELKDRLQLALSDVPMLIAILIAVVGLLFKL